MKPSEFLEKCRSQIADPKHWTQGCGARDKDGNQCDENVGNAVCWCSWGIVSKNGVGVETETRSIAYDALMTGMNGNVSRFNDNNPHFSVLNRWDWAIRSLKAQNL